MTRSPITPALDRTLRAPPTPTNSSMAKRSSMVANGRLRQGLDKPDVPLSVRAYRLPGSIEAYVRRRAPAPGRERLPPERMMPYGAPTKLRCHRFTRIGMAPDHRKRLPPEARCASWTGRDRKLPRTLLSYSARGGWERVAIATPAPAAKKLLRWDEPRQNARPGNYRTGKALGQAYNRPNCCPAPKNDRTSRADIRLHLMAWAPHNNRNCGRPPHPDRATGSTAPDLPAKGGLSIADAARDFLAAKSRPDPPASRRGRAARQARRRAPGYAMPMATATCRGLAPERSEITRTQNLRPK